MEICWSVEEDRQDVFLQEKPTLLGRLAWLNNKAAQWPVYLAPFSDMQN